MAQYHRAPCSGMQDRRQDPDRSGLPGAVRAEQPEDLTLWDLEVDPFQRLDGAEILGKPFNDDRWFRHGRHRRTCILNLSSF